MPKILILCRHAEAGFPPAGSTDFERPLTETGLKQAQQVNNWLLQKQIIPDMVVCSAAVRALTTAKIAAAMVTAENFISDKTLYDALPKHLLQKINETSDKVNILMLVGHNPSISQLAWQLTGRNFDLVPGQLAVLVSEINSWAELSEDMATIVHTFTPGYEEF